MLPLTVAAGHCLRRGRLPGDGLRRTHIPREVQLDVIVNLLKAVLTKRDAQPVAGAHDGHVALALHLLEFGRRGRQLLAGRHNPIRVARMGGFDDGLGLRVQQSHLTLSIGGYSVEETRVFVFQPDLVFVV